MKILKKLALPKQNRGALPPLHATAGLPALAELDAGATLEAAIEFALGLCVIASVSSHAVSVLALLKLGV